MAYHTGVYKKIQPFLKKKLIWESPDGFKVWENGGRWYLVFNDFKISELVNGKSSFDRNHKGSFDHWIEKVKQKDRKKIRGIHSKIETLRKDIELIESIWII